MTTNYPALLFLLLAMLLFALTGCTESERDPHRERGVIMICPTETECEYRRVP